MDCAREIRGTSSIANAVTPQSRKSFTSSGCWLVGRISWTPQQPVGARWADGLVRSSC
jgi:hypothetical protein